ncbi:MAG: adenylyltransferase/cytidyltransferase family protein [Candidatus Omnitrophica bacterium]|nr:adenylyltransferase/cytidyltransferase family protein [Candidatus Omnitrophota bacterium]
MVKVIISGGFDPIHIGHIRYISESKKLGDSLVVILNSDGFLKKKKNYVFMPFKERKEIVEHIKGVDSAVRCIDKDHTVRKTLEMLCSRAGKGVKLIFAKGGDRTLKNIPERETCERLGIKMVFGVGGRKIQSSSWLAKKHKART